MPFSENSTSKNFGKYWPVLLLALVGIGSYHLTQLAIPPRKALAGNPPAPAVIATTPALEPSPIPRKTDRPKPSSRDLPAIENGATPDQRTIVFQDQAALTAFLSKAGPGISILGRIDPLNALLIRFRDEADLTALLDGTEETGFNFPATIPPFESAGAQDGAVPLGSDLLKYLGIEGENSLWGLGVKIAVLDTGIADHLVFKQPIERINLIPLPENLAALNSHGTAVASLIFSSNPFAPGVSPSATPLSVRIADDNGRSSSFLLAQGIYAALDAGAAIINISLGGNGKSSILESALTAAQTRGVPVIVAAGNTGREGVLQPAASPKTIAVGAVDKNNQPMAFSSSGPEVSLSAPGFGINVAYPGNNAAKVSGTSSSTPIITGLIAGLASIGTSTPKPLTQTASLILSSLNDIGTLGPDSQTGGGVPNVATILNPKALDASLNSITISRTKNATQAHIMVQNLGTQPLVNTTLTTLVNGITTTANLTTLAPMQSRIISIPVPASGNLSIHSSVQISGNQPDQRTSNDTFSQTIPAPSPQP